MTDRQQHLDAKPAPDGRIAVKKWGSPMEDYPLATNATTGPFGLSVQIDQRVSKVLPWSSIEEYVVTRNSPEYELSLVQWLRDCDHDWVTSPRNGLTYCVYCRLDMADLEAILDPEASTAPALIIDDEQMDSESRSFDGRSGEMSAAAGEQHQGAVAHVTVVSDVPDCGCQSADEAISLRHSGPCKFRPETWGEPTIDDGSGF